MHLLATIEKNIQRAFLTMVEILSSLYPKSAVIANSTDFKFVQVNNDNQTFNRTEEDGTSNAKQRFAVYAPP